MDGRVDRADALLRSAARRLTGHQRRLFMAEVADALCGGSPRRAERRFGWGRGTVAKGLHERRSGLRCLENFAARGRRRTEDKDPRLAEDIRAIVEPRTYTDPELQSPRRYTNLSAAEVLHALQAEKGYAAADLPSERAMRDILNRLGYRIRRIQKGKPLKKPAQTGAIFASVATVREQARADPAALEISMDTKAKVNLGDYVRGGKNPDGRGRPGAEGLGPRPAGQGQGDPVGHPGAGERGAGVGLRVARDERLLGGRLGVVVAAGAGRPGAHQAAGDLPGQRAEVLGAADAVP
jgi:hypothetical protein